MAGSGLIAAGDGEAVGDSPAAAVNARRAVIRRNETQQTPEFLLINRDLVVRRSVVIATERPDSNMDADRFQEPAAAINTAQRLKADHWSRSSLSPPWGVSWKVSWTLEPCYRLSMATNPPPEFRSTESVSLAVSVTCSTLRAAGLSVSRRSVA